MHRRLWIFVVYCLSFPIKVYQNTVGKGFCMPPESKVIICCIGFYNSGDDCIECEPGTVGQNCSLSCPPGYHGIQCREQCDCSQEMYCDPTSGCLVNTSVASGQNTSEIFNKTITVSESNHRTENLDKSVLPFSIFGLVVTIVGTVCIRRRYTKATKKTTDELSSSNGMACSDATTQGSATDGLYSRDTVSSQPYKKRSLERKFHNPTGGHTDTIGTVGDPPPCPGLTPGILSYQSEENIHIDWQPHNIISVRNNEVLQNSCIDKSSVDERNTGQETYLYSTSSKLSRKQLRNTNSNEKRQISAIETINFKTQTSTTYTVADKENSTSTHKACSNGTFDEELYANNHDIEFFDSNLRQDGDSDEYFDVSYDEKMTRAFKQLNEPEQIGSNSSEPELCMTNYINCEQLTSVT